MEEDPFPGLCVGRAGQPGEPRVQVTVGRQAMIGAGRYGSLIAGPMSWLRGQERKRFVITLDRLVQAVSLLLGESHSPQRADGLMANHGLTILGQQDQPVFSALALSARPMIAWARSEPIH